MIRNHVVTIEIEKSISIYCSKCAHISIIPNTQCTNIEAIFYKFEENQETVETGEIDRNILQLIPSMIQKEVYEDLLWTQENYPNLDEILKVIFPSFQHNEDFITNRLRYHTLCNEEYSLEQKFIDLFCIELSIYLVANEFVTEDIIQVQNFPVQDTKLTDEFLSQNMMKILAMSYHVWLFDLDQFIAKLGYICLSFVKLFSSFFTSASNLELHYDYENGIYQAFDMAIAKLNFSIAQHNLEIQCLTEKYDSRITEIENKLQDIFQQYSNGNRSKW